MDSPALIPISNVVTSYLNATDNYSISQYRRMLQIVCENYTDLNIHHTSVFKSSLHVVGPTNTIPFPVDYIDYVRIGVIFNGKIYPLTLNEKILNTKAIVCGVEATDSSLVDAILNDWAPSMSAYGGRNFLYYRADKATRTIVFDGDGVGRTIVLQYISSGVSMDGETMIPVQMLIPLREYLHWTLLRFDPKASDVKVERARRDFKKFLGEFERLDISFTAEEFIDAMRQSYRQTIKF